MAPCANLEFMCAIVAQPPNGRYVTDTTKQAAVTDDTSQWLWIAASLAAHASWGVYPVLARYLQTISNLPTFSILVAGNLVVLVFLSRYLLRHTDRSVLRQPIVWAFGLIVMLRAVTNIASTRFTLSIYVQLVTQATPFLVILLSTLVFREKLPRFTIPAVTLALIGAVLMIGSNFGAVPDDPTRRDWLGVGLAFFSVMALATYMVLVRRTVKHHIRGESLLLIQLITIISISSIMSLIVGEDWGQYLRLGVTDWAIFFVFTFLVFLGANLWQIQAIQHIGAPFHSSMLATRLVSALIFGWLLLGERLESVWQVVGAVIVLVTITWYLWQQRGH